MIEDNDPVAQFRKAVAAEHYTTELLNVPVSAFDVA